MEKELDYHGEVAAGCRYAFEVVEPLGLGVRSSMILVGEFEKMRGDIVIGTEQREGDARSIMDLLTLAVGWRSTGFLRFSETQPAAPLEGVRRIIRIMEADHEQ